MVGIPESQLKILLREMLVILAAGVVVDVDGNTQPITEVASD